jgi:hypothetical protein
LIKGVLRFSPVIPARVDEGLLGRLVIVAGKKEQERHMDGSDPSDKVK